MSFRLQKNEPLADAVGRIISEQLAHAGAQLANKDVQADTAVHEVRKVVEKLDALLQLIHPALKKKSFRRQHKRLQRLGRQLGNSVMLPDTLNRLTDHFSIMLDDSALEAVRQSLASHHSMALQQQSATLDITAIRKKLGVLEQQLAGLQLGRLSGKTLQRSIRKSWRRCRQALAQLRAVPTTANSHSFSRQVKSLWYQLRLLRRKKHIKALRYSDTLRDIEQLLGQDNDLAVLIGTLHDYPEISGNPVCRELLISLAETRRIVLLSRALRLAKPVFGG